MHLRDSGRIQRPCFAATILLAFILLWLPIDIGANASDAGCDGVASHLYCETNEIDIPNLALGAFTGTEFVSSFDCGAGVPTATGQGAACLARYNLCVADGQTVGRIFLLNVFSTATNQFLRTEYTCDGGAGVHIPTLAELRDAVTRYAPVPQTVSGGTNYLVNGAVVFYANRPADAPLRDLTIADIPLAGLTLTAKLHLTSTEWSWGDGTTTTVASGSLTGTPYSPAHPCESLTVCSAYVSHSFSTSGTRTVRVEAFWDVTVTIAGSTVGIPVTGGVHRPDAAGRTVVIRSAHSILVR